MRFLYVTDLHGNRELYDTTAEAAVHLDVSLIVNGGDMLPRQGDDDVLTNQRKSFNWLRRHLGQVRERRIDYFAMFGNDDCRVLLTELAKLAREGLLLRLDDGWVQHKGWHFVGFPWVPDTPFLLKDWSLLDSEGWRVPPQYGAGVLSTERGFEEIRQPSQEYLSRFDTIEEALSKAPYSMPPDPGRSIFVMHAPPAGTKLDICWDGREVGSRAGREFVERMKFPLTLHGHIHEAPGANGGIWTARFGDSTAVNPGADGGPNWVLVDTDVRTLRHATRGEAGF